MHVFSLRLLKYHHEILQKQAEDRTTNSEMSNRSDWGICS